ncbi:MAG: chromosome segregation protein SMC [Nevskiaceae bacterium]|nr:MAG: chromosome segregation protein SMC [Nevskiaceae bacterium]TBR74057.1 MAG: chromosome segregation protein SMC [Nevskiaceae bacterium]
MRLTAIKLAGFKSFVDPTTLPLPTNRTAVVGPNGSGKSNLIDAVRWVLGESSAKALRGAESEDVIFNGAKTRKPAGRASVELRFDNADQTLQGAWGRFNEIAVRREVVRGIGSQYYINGQKCLKRDVVDLFLGTGLGGRNQYAILEQGTVAQLVEAKPDELRRWLEEAAGISRYKERRRETESRIRQTRDNLARLGDLQGEIEKRLKVLARQAADAERYNESKQQERQLRAELLLLRRRAVAQDAARCQAHIDAVERELVAAREALQVASQQREAAEQARNAAGEAFNSVQAQAYEAQAQVSREEQGLAHAREMQAVHERETRATETRLSQLDERVARDTQTLAALEANVASLQRETQQVDATRTAAVQRQQQAEAQLAAERERWAEFERRSQAPMLDAERERAQVQALENGARGLEQRHQRLQRERETLDEAPLQASLFEADAELEMLSHTIEAAQAQLAAHDQSLQALRAQGSVNEASLHDARHSAESLRGRVASLETLQQAALKVDDKALGRWLGEQGWGSRPRLVDVLRVDAGWEAAVEHVLAGLLQAPVLDDWQASTLPVAGPAAGAVAVAVRVPEFPAAAGTLAAHVTGSAAVHEWLAGIHVANDAAGAVAALAAITGAGESVVTPDGVWRGRGWVRYPCRNAADTGVIARGQLLRETQAASTAAQTRVRELDVVEQTLRAQIQTLEVERRDAATQLDRARARHGQRLAERQAQAVRLDQVRQRAATLAEELAALDSERCDIAQQWAAAREKLAALTATVEALRAERAQLTSVLQQARNVEAEARRAHGLAVESSNRAQVRAAGQASALQAARHNLDELQVQRATLAQALDAARVQDSDFAAPVQACVAQAERARATLRQAEEKLRAGRERIAIAEAAVREAQHALQASENRRDQVRETLQQARVAQEGERSRLQALDAQLGETQQDIAALEQALAVDAGIAAWEERLAQVAHRIERLGAINLAAIPELEEARGRATYFTAQRADLDAALTTLESAMTQLDRETRDMFRTTFERVDARFRECCPRLFGGGEAGLERTDDDWLACGVRVMVRPPGKRNTAIQLLSGGEKALSALALLFALFELNPAPFCLLDEVEAPLDEANVRRFSALVQDMSRNVQFVIITHNKVTMELAEHLHGVTMQEPGVSRLVSVDVREAERLTQPDATALEV